MPADLYIGLMSGTSLDGVDAAIASFDHDGQRTLATAYLPYPDDIRREALALHDAGHDELHRTALLAEQLAQLYGEACRMVLAAASLSAHDIRAIGCHGQTIRHRPDCHYTLQVNAPALLAEITGIAVVADFRSRDMAAGGQGAPLAPAAHKAFFQSATHDRGLLNLGGIANLTHLPPTNNQVPIVGFDCGPANILMDTWSQQERNIPYDAEGAWARTGTVLNPLLDKLFAHPFFEQYPPKSCGREEFNLNWLHGYLDGTESSADVQRTLLELSCKGAADAVRRWMPSIDELFLCGGGAHNTLLRERLGDLLPDVTIDTTESLGIAPDWLEAIAFAWLAHQNTQGMAGNLPSATGAAGERILGAYYPA